MADHGQVSKELHIHAFSENVVVMFSLSLLWESCPYSLHATVQNRMSSSDVGNHSMNHPSALTRLVVYPGVLLYICGSRHDSDSTLQG